MTKPQVPLSRAKTRLISTSAGTNSDAFGLPEWGLLAGIAMIWGSSFLFISVGLDSLRPGVIALARIGLGALTLSVVPRARKPIEREDYPRVALLGVIWMGIPLMLFPIAQQWIDSSVAGMINGAVPLTSALVATVLLRKLPGKFQMAGLTIGFSGLVLVSYPSVRGADAQALGVALVVLAIILYGFSTNISVPLQQKYGSLPVLWRVQLVALVVVTPFGLYHLPGSTFELAPVLAMIPLGVFGTALAFVAMTTLMGRTGAARGSVAIYFVPVVAVTLGVAFRDETLHLISLAGMGLILIGAWLTSRAEK